ncbi:hypothetical protein EWE75_02035 [Sphingomonas populi]|uniref:Uncharacterized protein n=1 Tax=Sphingomonas populi TaxID=2484750 RepID=A0A4Q6Y9P4_9SPHN|nr:hypothetical protein [Sphingomonas populi]RZF66186.1 hypothetical protein EWE75_02035 [Sphingomonas populi]
MSFGLEKILPLVPAVGGVVLVLAAVYARSLIDVLGKSLDKLNSLKSLPAKDRESALEVIEIGLKIDKIETAKLSAAHRFELIKAAMEERTTKAWQRFWLLVLTGAMMLILAAGWFAYSVLTKSREDQLNDALTRDPDAFSQVLERKGYYSIKGMGIVNSLASITGLDTSDLRKAIEQAQALDRCDPSSREPCNVTLVQLRARARSREAPFNDVGIFVTAAKPEYDPPRRFYVNVTEFFPFKHVPVVIRSLDGSRYLRLMPRVAIVGSTDKDLIHLNEAQIGYIFGNKNLFGGNKGGASTVKAVALPVTQDNPQLFDPFCSDFWKNRDALCLLKGKTLGLDDLIDRATRAVKS